jgi:hypothetical protein
MTQIFYAHMNKIKIKRKKKRPHHNQPWKVITPGQTSAVHPAAVAGGPQELPTTTQQKVCD